MGRVMLDVQGHTLSAEERDMLDHPMVGGVILFTRNYDNLNQLRDLVRELREAARQPLVIAVDHEGGRVQRFRHGFSRLPAMGSILERCNHSLGSAQKSATELGWLMAAELRAMDIDLSFAPVLDMHGISDVIGDRAFHSDGDVIVHLAAAFIHGMQDANMASCGKHFPGHGNVKEDSHVAIPRDLRSKDEIFNKDMAVFTRLHQMRLLDALMPAHVIYPAVDEQPAGFSKIWIEQVLRQQLGFAGVVFSDDLSMQGAAVAGDYAERAEAAINAGCDVALICNNPQGAMQILDKANIGSPTLPMRTLKRPATLTWRELQQSDRWQYSQRLLD